AERFPDAHLWPADPAARAVARAVSSEMHAGFTALRAGMPMNLRRPVAPPRESSDAIRSDIAHVLQLWADTRARFARGGPFLSGASPIAAAMFAPVVTRSPTSAVALAGEPAAYAAAVWDDPAMQRWIAAARAETLPLARYEGANQK